MWFFCEPDEELGCWY